MSPDERKYLRLAEHNNHTFISNLSETQAFELELLKTEEFERSGKPARVRPVAVSLPPSSVKDLGQMLFYADGEIDVSVHFSFRP